MINKIFKPYKTIKELNNEIDNQDKQYTQLQQKMRKIRKTMELLIEENDRLEKSNTEYLVKLRNKTKEIKELKRKLKEYEK